MVAHLLRTHHTLLKIGVFLWKMAKIANIKLTECIIVHNKYVSICTYFKFDTKDKLLSPYASKQCWDDPKHRYAIHINEQFIFRLGSGIWVLSADFWKNLYTFCHRNSRSELRRTPKSIIMKFSVLSVAILENFIIISIGLIFSETVLICSDISK